MLVKNKKRSFFFQNGYFNAYDYLLFTAVCIDLLSDVPQVVRLDLHEKDDLSSMAIELLSSQGYHFRKDILNNSYASSRDSHIFIKDFRESNSLPGQPLKLNKVLSTH